MKKLTFPQSQPDFINFSYKEVSSYKATLHHILQNSRGKHLYFKDKQILRVNKIQWLLQKIRGVFGLKEYTHLLVIDSAILKFLYLGEAQKYLSEKETKALVAKVRDDLSHSKYSQDFHIKKFVDEIQQVTLETENNRLLKLRKLLIEFHQLAAVKKRLKPDWLERLFSRSIKKSSLLHFGDIHLKLAKRHLKKGETAKSLQQCIRAFRLKNLSPEFHEKWLKHWLELFSLAPKTLLQKWEQSVYPVLKTCIHEAMLKNQFQEAKKHVVAARKIVCSDHYINLVYYELLYKEGCLHHEPSTFESVFLKELEECRQKQQNPRTPSQKLELDNRIAELYEMVGSSLSKKNSHVSEVFRAVEYLEKYLKITTTTPLLDQQLFQLYISHLHKILHHPLPICPDLTILADKAYALNPHKFIPEMNSCLLKLAQGYKNLEAIELYELLEKNIPDLIPPYRAYYNWAKQVESSLKKDRIENVERLLQIFKLCDGHGYNCKGEIKRYTQLFAQLKSRTHPHEALLALLKLDKGREDSKVEQSILEISGRIVKGSLDMYYSQELKKEIAELFFSTKRQDAPDIEFLEKAVYFYPENSSFNEQLFLAYLETGDRIKNSYALTKLFSKKGHFSDYYWRAYDLMPRRYDRHIQDLIALCVKNKNFEKAIQIHQNMPHHLPSFDANIYFQQGLIFEKELNAEKAFEMYKQAAILKPSESCLDKLSAVALTAYHQLKNQPIKAIKFLEEAATMAQSDSTHSNRSLWQKLKKLNTHIKSLLLNADANQKHQLLQQLTQHYTLCIQEALKNHALDHASQYIDKMMLYTDEECYLKPLRDLIISYYETCILKILPSISVHNRMNEITPSFLEKNKKTILQIIKLYDSILKLDMENAPAHFDKAMLIDFYFLEIHSDLFPELNLQDAALYHFEKAASYKKNYFYYWMVSKSYKALKKEVPSSIQSAMEKCSDEMRKKMNQWMEIRFNPELEALTIPYKPHTEAVFD